VVIDAEGAKRSPISPSYLARLIAGNIAWLPATSRRCRQHRVAPAL